MKRAYEILGFNDTRMRLIGIPVMAFFIPILFFKVGLTPEELWENKESWYFSLLYTAVFWEGNRYILIRLRERFPETGQTRLRLVIQGLIMVVFVLSFCNGINLLVSWCTAGIDVDRPTVAETNIVSLFMVVLCLSFYEGVYYFNKLKQTMLEAEQLKRANVQAQLDTLKSQVNPHFLFNSLNTLATLIPEDQDQAVDFVQKLSKVYRYILEIRDRELITLKEELECLHAYIFLLKSRFGENVNIRIDIHPDHYSSQIVPLTLQILLENAIKHNIISMTRPLYIELFEGEENRLIVRNNLQRKNQVIHSTKTGLQNIKERYRFHSGKEVDVMVTNNYFTVSVPLIRVASYERIDH